MPGALRQPATRRPMPGLAKWHFTASAEVQLFEDETNAGHSTLTLGVLPLEPERERLSSQAATRRSISA